MGKEASKKIGCCKDRETRAMILRPYQDKLIDRARQSLLQGHRSPLLVAPCGSGKTVMFCYFARKTMEKRKRILILAHRSELLSQISETLKEFAVPHTFIAPHRDYNSNSQVQVASVYSVVRRLHKVQSPDLIIVDEAHHAIKQSTFGRVLAFFPKAFRVGVSATPQRLSGESLSDLFDDLIIGPSVTELTTLGALAPYRLFAPPTMNTEGFHIRGGDYAKEEINQAADKPTITGSAVEHYRRLASGKRAVAFCCSIQHARHVAESFKGAGYSSECIDGTLTDDARHHLVRRFKNGEIQILTSCDIISEGFDLPAIEVGIMLRPTASLGLWIQQSGRTLRTYPGKECAIIADHAGNVLRHGLPDGDRKWTLEGSIMGNRGTERNGSSVRICKSCFAAQVSGTAQCCFCGYVFEVKPREVPEKEGELSEVNLTTARVSMLHERKKQGQAQTMEDLYRLGVSRGMKNPRGWAYYVFKARQAKKLGRVA